MKKRIAAVMVCLAVMAMAVGGTMAYFTADSTATNVITSGNIDITLEEWAVEDEIPFEDVAGVMSGESVDKIVKVRNIGSNPAYVRVEIEKVITLAGNADGSVDTSLLHCPINTDYWVEKDGYYYYKNILGPGEVTEPLFESVIFDKAMGNQYQNCTAKIIVNAEAVQSENNENADVTAVKGWPEVK